MSEPTDEPPPLPSVDPAPAPLPGETLSGETSPGETSPDEASPGGPPVGSEPWWARGPLVRELRADRPLLVATVVMLALTWAPLLVTPFLPLQDLPDHVGMASVLGPAARGAGELGARYRVDWSPLPYWSGVLLTALAQAALGPRLGAKAVVGLLVALWPLGVMRLQVALGRSARLGLWAFALGWSYSLYFGWLSFALGLGASLWLLAWVIEARGLRAHLRLVPAGVLLGLTHVLAAGFFLVQLGAQVVLGGGSRRERLERSLAGLGVVAALGPWAWRIVSARGAGRAAWAAQWDGAGDKIAGLFRDTLDTLPATGGWTGGACVLLLLLGPALVGLLPARPASAHDRRAVVVAVVGLALYLALPRHVMAPVDHWGTGPRFAAAALLGWLLVPRPALAGRQALALAPGLVLVAAHLALVTRQFRAFGAETAPLARLIEAAPPARRLLPLVFDNGRPMLPDHRPMNQLHAYLAAHSGSFDPYYLDAPGLDPVQYRAEGRPPAPPWFAPGQFSLERHGPFYDQVLVQGLERDPLTGAPGVRRVAEQGIWRLYTIERP